MVIVASVFVFQFCLEPSTNAISFGGMSIPSIMKNEPWLQNLRY